MKSCVLSNICAYFMQNACQNESLINNIDTWQFIKSLSKWIISITCGTYLSSFMAISSGSVSPSNSTITGAHILWHKINIIWKVLNIQRIMIVLHVNGSDTKWWNNEGKEVIQIGRKVNKNAVELRLGVLSILSNTIDIAKRVWSPNHCFFLY